MGKFKLLLAVVIMAGMYACTGDTHEGVKGGQTEVDTTGIPAETTLDHEHDHNHDHDHDDHSGHNH